MLLATAWGPRHGGINAFNVALARSLGITPGRSFGLVCVVPEASADDHGDATRHGVALVALGSAPGVLSPGDAAQMLSRLPGLLTDRAIWLGHDDKTGPLALALRQQCPGSRLVLVNHMAFAAYHDFKKAGSTEPTQPKRVQQRALFLQANLCVAVGPMLQQQLQDLLRPTITTQVEMLVPGLADPDPDTVNLSHQPPHNFTAFIGGRLGSDDERIKQALLGVRGYGMAVKVAFDSADSQHAMCRSPSLRMRGVPADQHHRVRAEASGAAQQVLNCDLADYTEDRACYLRDLASSSVALTPSRQEGFGLTAWKAIACQVPRPGPGSPAWASGLRRCCWRW